VGVVGSSPIAPTKIGRQHRQEDMLFRTRNTTTVVY